LNKLAEVLARITHLGQERDAVCAAVNENWTTVSGVILKAQRGVDMRKIPLIRYRLNGCVIIGSTNKNGHLRLVLSDTRIKETN
jgi:hypothetical protein